MHDTQLLLFDARAAQPPPRDPSVTEACEAKRLSRQCGQIIAAFRANGNRLTNDQLSRISRKYTSRISDARKCGYRIVVESRDFKTGLTVYLLTNP